MLRKIIRSSYGLFLLLSISIAGCYGGSDYGHKLPIIGEVDISLNDKGNLCFKPLFDTAKLGGGAQQPMPIKYLKMDRLRVYDVDKIGDDYKEIVISPTTDKYFIVYDKQPICLNSDNPDLYQEDFGSFGKGKKMVVHMSGFNDDEKNVYSTLFYKEFDYHYTANASIL